MVYYALTPILIYCYNQKKWIGNIVFLISFLIGLYFAFYLIDSKSNLSHEWSTYINPLNNLFLYVMGIGMYYNLKDLKIRNGINIAILLFTCVLFSFFSTKVDLINVVVGFNRLFFVFFSFIIVLCFYKMELKLPIILSVSLETLGIATYGVYILHPIVYIGVNALHFTNVYLNFGLVTIITILSAILLYKFFETKFIRLGKSVTTSLLKKRALIKKSF
jgi:exopolysaccharide production protein ExoZ